MNPGRLRERITIQTLADLSSDEHRSPTAVQTWEDMVSVRADVREDGGREDVRAGKDEPDLRARFRIRTRESVTEEERIKWNGEIWRIEAVRYHGRMRRYMDVFTVYSGETDG